METYTNFEIYNPAYGDVNFDTILEDMVRISNSFDSTTHFSLIKAKYSKNDYNLVITKKGEDVYLNKNFIVMKKKISDIDALSFENKRTKKNSGIVIDKQTVDMLVDNQEKFGYFFSGFSGELEILSVLFGTTIKNFLVTNY